MKRLARNQGLAMRLVVAAAVVGVPAIAGAAPVYLECTTFNEHSKKMTNYKITLDEAARTVTFTDDGLTLGRATTRPAQFAQTEVLFTNVIVGLPLNYRIDRVSLEFTQTSGANKSKVDRGTCKVSAPVERAF